MLYGRSLKRSMRILGLRGISLPVVPRDYVHLMAITNVVIQNNILYLFTKKKKKRGCSLNAIGLR